MALFSLLRKEFQLRSSKMELCHPQQTISTKCHWVLCPKYQAKFKIGEAELHSHIQSIITADKQSIDVAHISRWHQIFREVISYPAELLWSTLSFKIHMEICGIAHVYSTQSMHIHGLLVIFLQAGETGVLIDR